MMKDFEAIIKIIGAQDDSTTLVSSIKKQLGALPEPFASFSTWYRDLEYWESLLKTVSPYPQLALSGCEQLTQLDVSLPPLQLDMRDIVLAAFVIVLHSYHMSNFAVGVSIHDTVYAVPVRYNNLDLTCQQYTSEFSSLVREIPRHSMCTLAEISRFLNPTTPPTLLVTEFHWMPTLQSVEKFSPWPSIIRVLATNDSHGILHLNLLCIDTSLGNAVTKDLQYVLSQFGSDATVSSLRSGLCGKVLFRDTLQKAHCIAENKVPTNEIEITLHTIWSKVLGLAAISCDDNFFAIGGNSLQAIQIAVAIGRFLKIALPLQLIYRYSTISSLADALTHFSQTATQGSECGDGCFECVK